MRIILPLRKLGRGNAVSIMVSNTYVIIGISNTAACTGTSSRGFSRESHFLSKTVSHDFLLPDYQPSNREMHLVGSVYVWKLLCALLCTELRRDFRLIFPF